METKIVSMNTGAKHVPPIGLEYLIAFLKNKKILFAFTALCLIGITMYISYIAYIYFGEMATTLSFVFLLVSGTAFVYVLYEFQKEWDQLRIIQLPEVVFEERKKQLIKRANIVFYIGAPSIFIQSFAAVTLSYIEQKQPQFVVTAKAQVAQKKADSGKKTAKSTQITPVPEDPDEYIAYKEKQGIYKPEFKNDNRAIIHAPKKAERVWAYVKRFYTVATSESAKFNIPTSIILGQGILESNCGDSELCNKANNHFGIKTFDKKVPHVVMHDDYPTDKFKIYNSAWESYRDHSLFLMKDRYSNCRSYGKKNYTGWAKGLKIAGYATDPLYDKKLIEIIELYQLYKYD